VPCREIRLRQVAEIRLAPDGAWLAHEAEQRIDPLGVAFRWEARTRMARLFPVTIVDAFEGGQGELTVRLFGVIPLVRGRGAEFDRGEAMRGLVEMPWHPFGFTDHPGLTWAAAEGGGLHAAFDDGRTRAAVDFQLDDEGRVLGGRAANRPRWVGKTVVETPWSGAFSEYKEFDGVRVPTRAEVGWDLPEGRFSYWRGEVVSFRIIA
jgi:uncharacterized protein DUF6544